MQGGGRDGEHLCQEQLAAFGQRWHTVDLTTMSGMIFDIDTFAVHDGPGIRMTVYFKGCPLRCAWCHSPESQAREPQLIFARERCILCGACVMACSQGVHSLVDGKHILAWELCRACGQCVATCASRALQMRGEHVTAAEIVRRAIRMKPFFEHSGGGITLTGGEVTMQPDFAVAILRACQAEGIHTAIETCGACAWPTLQRLLPHTDLVLYDLKLVDDRLHRRWTGASNRIILENLAQLAREREVQVRVPLIPGITDSTENLGAVLDLMADLGLNSLALLPYNEAAGAKYEWLERHYAIEGQRQSEEDLQRWVALAAERGIVATIS